MNRRRFLGSSAALLAAGMVDPERLLWVPGQRTIFIPPQVTLSPTNEFISWMTGVQIKLVAMQLHRLGRIDTATLLRSFDIPNTNKVVMSSSSYEMWRHGFDSVPTILSRS